MLYGQDRNRLRSIYCEAWQAHREGRDLEPLQARIVAVIERHPEYQRLLENPERALGAEFPPESGQTNPFLHMSMHLAIVEQIDTDRPPGVRTLYLRLSTRFPDPHEREHRVMECLAQMLWQAQNDGKAPDEQGYLDCLSALAGPH